MSNVQASSIIQPSNNQGLVINAVNADVTNSPFLSKVLFRKFNFHRISSDEKLCMRLNKRKRMHLDVIYRSLFFVDPYLVCHNC